ncbi:MAG: cytochrome C [Desulfuromonas sp.]|nr:MAG: cytochrome C [Desulfuromonas sp.]
MRKQKSEWFFLLLCPLLLGSCIAGFPRSTEVERGRYVIEIMGCNDCHTPDYMARGGDVPEDEWLTGGLPGFHGSWGTAYPTNLRLLMDELSLEGWISLSKQMRQDSPMAWVMLPKLDDNDLAAVYSFVRFLGPRGEPARPRLPAGVTPDTDYLNFPDPH